jgi:hypothetical protein
MTDSEAFTPREHDTIPEKQKAKISPPNARNATIKQRGYRSLPINRSNSMTNEQGQDKSSWRYRRPPGARDMEYGGRVFEDPVPTPARIQGICGNPNCLHHEWGYSLLTGARYEEVLPLNDNGTCFKCAEKETPERQKTEVVVKSKL